MRRFRARRSFVLRREPSAAHRRNPNAPLPVDGCKCEDCENARDDAHYEKVGKMLGLDDEPTESGAQR